VVNCPNEGIDNACENPALVNGSGADEGPANGNPGALAGATGANNIGLTIREEDYTGRAMAATALAYAIAACWPADAVKILDAALTDLRRGPVPALLAIMPEARLWAAAASRSELKCYVVAAFEAMRPADQAAFLRTVGGRVQ